MAASSSAAVSTSTILHAAVADGVVVAEAVRLLHDDLGLHAREVRQIDDLLRVAAGQHAGRAERHRRRGAGRHHRGLGLDQRRDPLADAIVQLVERHEVLGRVVDRRHHLGRHQRRRHVGVGAGRVDEGPDAELLEVVAGGGRGRLRRAGGPARGSRRPAAAWTGARRRYVGSTSRLLCGALDRGRRSARRDQADANPFRAPAAAPGW